MGRLLCMVVICAGCGRVGFDLAGGPPVPGDDATLSSDAAAALCGGARLVAHYTLDDTSGASILDATGNQNGVWTDVTDGDVTADAMPGRIGGALRFDTGSSIAVPGLVMPSEGTFAVWLTSTFDDTSTPAQHPMVIDAPTPRTTISFAGNIASYGLRTNDVSWQAAYAPPTDMTDWFHLVATWSATGAQLFIDGILRASGAGDARSTSPAGLFIGTREQLDRWWFGLIDDVRIYDYAMSGAEVSALFACP